MPLSLQTASLIKWHAFAAALVSISCGMLSHVLKKSELPFPQSVLMALLGYGLAVMLVAVVFAVRRAFTSSHREAAFSFWLSVSCLSLLLVRSLLLEREVLPQEYYELSMSLLAGVVLSAGIRQMNRMEQLSAATGNNGSFEQ